jgi:P-type conjugative transfer protein TrbJ
MRSRAIAAVVALALTLLPAGRASALFGAGDIVFDPENFAQNLLTAARTLEMINNQIESLQNEVRMLEGMAKHLQRLDYSSLAGLQSSLARLTGLMSRAKGMAFTIDRAEQEFARLYPTDYAATVSGDELARDARARWERAMAAHRQSLLVQSEVVQNLTADGSELGRLVAESQGAVGSLQAQQAANQILALLTKQQLQTQSLIATHNRAVALEQARTSAAQEQARAQFSRFLGDRSAYPAR